MPTQVIVTDIEGTTTPIAFVKQALFPYARRRIAAFVVEHAEDPEIRAQLDALSRLENRALTSRQAGALLERWIDQDRKATPLKILEGMIWRQGYLDGELQGQVYPDVPPALRAWRAKGLRCYVYSSGSIEAQQLLFGHTPYGDLRECFDGYFDTRIGAKRETQAYRRIAETSGVPPQAILFLSDTADELTAARAAGLEVCQLLRAEDGTVPAAGFPHARDFAGISVGSAN
ncbi:MAG: acireductone synthase [Gammaproteobacteria bacterium]|nr:acireductone synthase [Gammaproteobacteria bacterium]